MCLDTQLFLLQSEVCPLLLHMRPRQTSLDPVNLKWPLFSRSLVYTLRRVHSTGRCQSGRGSLATVCHTAGLISVWVAAGPFCPTQKGGLRSGQQNQRALRSYLLWCKCITRGSRRKWCRAPREEGDERIRCLFRALSPILGPLQQIKIISQTDS